MTQKTTSIPQHSIRTVLNWVVLGCLLPGIIGAVILFAHQYQESRARQQKDMVQTARALVQAVDSHLLRGQAIAQTLSTADSLVNKDFARFHQQARGAIALFGPGNNVVLRDQAQQLILNTSAEYGAPLPRQPMREHVQRVFATGTPAISNLFIGLLRKQPIVSIDVPVMINGKVAYVVGVGIQSDHFTAILKAQNLPSDWIGAVFDSSGTIVGRNRSAEKFVGNKVTINLYQAIEQAQEGSIDSISQEGTPVLTSFARSSTTNWGVAIGIPRQFLQSSQIWPIFKLAIGIAALFGLGLILARVMGGKIASSVTALTVPAMELGSGRSPSLPALQIKEATEVAVAIDHAARLLRERAMALDAKEQELIEAHRLAKFGTWHWDLTTGEVEISESVREIYGRDVPTFPEQKGTLLPVESWERINVALQNGMKTGSGYDLEIQVNHGKGHTIWISSKCDAVKNNKNEVIGLRGTVQDITERKEYEEALLQADRRKDEFLAMLAHELRNPLAPISAAADLLGLGILDDARVQSTSAIIARQVKHMTALIDDLLDVSRVTRGLIRLEKQKLDAIQMVYDAVEQVRPLVEARRHRLSVHLPHEPVFVSGDQKRLIQVLANLLNNAAKFTPEGGDLVLSIDIDNDHVKMTVADNGIGMAPGVAQRAFELFAQGERTPDRSQGGLGIGLALAKSLVELHGGQVTAHSDGIGMGSRFTVCLPHLNKEISIAGTEQGIAIPPVPTRTLKVMIVDDNADAAQMLAMFVEALGHQVFVEHSSQRALERTRTEVLDLYLLDIGLPEMDGNKLAQCLRAQSGTANSVLIAVTGYGQENDRKEALAAGFDYHLVKPVDMTMLTALLTEISRV